MPERPKTSLKRCALKNNYGFFGNYACTTFVALVMAKNVEKTSKTGRNGSSAAANGPSAAANGPSAAANGPFSGRKWSLNGPQTVAQRAADALLFAGRFRKSARIDVLMA